ncbi:MAG: protein kinase [Acidipila sp.]|nr:protein kinase [Acidipila sp.]
MIGKILGHYRIVEKMGAGGMGEVYLAHDERLERNVALKVLPAGSLADEATRSRFRKEALALSKLNHPNIATIHDFDTDGGVDFIAMELVDGETLAQRAKTGALAEKDVLTLAAQVADALEEAHEYGIVHRDLKPANVMVTSKGRAKVLDFGLAKLLHPVNSLTTAETLNQTKGVAGTLPYMSPEQLRDEPVDARSDIFSFGAVLYEMTTGQLPFQEAVVSRLTDAILHRAPVTPRALNSRTSPELERIILKCLEKEPDRRYQSAKELGVDLRRLSAPSALVATDPAPPERKAVSRKMSRTAMVSTAGAAVVLAILLAVFAMMNVGGWRQRIFGRGNTPKIQSLAVLPLANLSADPSQEYFADGMTEELITELAQISGLRVISRTSAMRYKGSREPLPSIAQALNVDAVIEGSVERSGEQVRITAQLINARTDTHLWARSYQRNLRDVLALQTEVARAIAGEVQVQLTPQEHERLDRTRAVNPAAYEAYLRGRYHWNFHTPDEMQKAIGEYQNALHIDSDYPLAYVGLSDVYRMLTLNADAEPQKVVPVAKANAIKALQLDPQLSEAHLSLAYALEMYDWDWAGAEKEFKRSIELSPNNPFAHSYYGRLLSVLGRNSEAFVQGERARELDPVSNQASFLLGTFFHYGRQDDRAVQELNDSITINAHFWPAHLYLGKAFTEKRLYPQALGELQKAQGPTLQALSSMAYVFASSGNESGARKILNDLIQRSKQSYVPPTHIAIVYAGLGEKDQAIAWLQKGFAVKDAHLEFLGVEPVYDSLRSDPRFADMIARLGLPH